MNGRTREGFYVLWTIAILVCLAMSIFVLLYTSFTHNIQTAAAPQAVPANDVQPQPQDDEAPEEASPPQTVSQATGSIDDVVFLGDSVIYSLLSNGSLPKPQVWTSADGTLSLVTLSVASVDYYAPDTPDSAQSMTVANALAWRQPAYLVVALGKDGLNMLSEASFKGQYAALISTIRANSPNTVILCQSILPVIDALASDSVGNASINEANDWIRAVAEENGLRYLNTHDALIDGTGNLSTAYADADGVHLNSAGCSALLDYVQANAF